MMYLRPGNLKKDFIIERRTGSLSPRGRAQATYDESGAEMLKAVLAQATPEEKERWSQLQHPITHVLVQAGRPKAHTSDRLVHRDRRFYIQGMDEPGELGHSTIYYVQERRDTGGHQPEQDHSVQGGEGTPERPVPGSPRRQ